MVVEREWEGMKEEGGDPFVSFCGVCGVCECVCVAEVARYAAGCGVVVSASLAISMASACICAIPITPNALCTGSFGVGSTSSSFSFSFSFPLSFASFLPSVTTGSSTPTGLGCWTTYMCIPQQTHAVCVIQRTRRNGWLLLPVRCSNSQHNRQRQEVHCHTTQTRVLGCSSLFSRTVLTLGGGSACNNQAQPKASCLPRPTAR